MKTEKINVQKICLIAFAICINFVGGQIALFLKLPIYLDSIGTVFIASILGPFYGMLPNLISGLLMGMTVDVYSLYYAPVGIVLGFVTGLVYRKFQPKKWQIFPAAIAITLPSTLISPASLHFCSAGSPLPVPPFLYSFSQKHLLEWSEAVLQSSLSPITLTEFSVLHWQLS